MTSAKPVGGHQGDRAPRAARAGRWWPPWCRGPAPSGGRAARARRRPSRTASPGSAGVDGTLAMRPSSATTSVNVPPVSTPTRIVRDRSGADARDDAGMARLWSTQGTGPARPPRRTPPSSDDRRASTTDDHAWWVHGRRRSRRGAPRPPAPTSTPERDVLGEHFGAGLAHQLRRSTRPEPTPSSAPTPATGARRGRSTLGPVRGARRSSRTATWDEIVAAHRRPGPRPPPRPALRPAPTTERADRRGADPGRSTPPTRTCEVRRGQQRLDAASGVRRAAPASAPRWSSSERTSRPTASSSWSQTSTAASTCWPARRRGGPGRRRRSCLRRPAPCFSSVIAASAAADELGEAAPWTRPATGLSGSGYGSTATSGQPASRAASAAELSAPSRSPLTHRQRRRRTSAFAASISPSRSRTPSAIGLAS